MKSPLFLAILLVSVRLGAARSAPYAVDCPGQCDSNECKSSLLCTRTVLDDCGCCRVCAAGAGETCYRTVSGMDGVKCGPGLRCHFYTEEDDFGDEFGICKECPYGTYGMECRNTCSCPSGICDRVNGKCLKFPFFQLNAPKPPTKQKLISHSESDMASGDGSDLKEEYLNGKTIRSPGMKWLHPR
ncbi:endothelial cell-specific molecule 1 [Rhinatrema bivittatum]|uniref:endothelial cell-specific molecule 1 n=1 Tax=Rhinatrema bivittatum TaxID=194408 RepID=UPI00112D5B14|nr:endothelial cell-specific molecule 1 [Rhinatrema bivittatum]